MNRRFSQNLERKLVVRPEEINFAPLPFVALTIDNVGPEIVIIEHHNAAVTSIVIFLFYNGDVGTSTSKGLLTPIPPTVLMPPSRCVCLARKRRSASQFTRFSICFPLSVSVYDTVCTWFSLRAENIQETLHLIALLIKSLDTSRRV